MKPSNGKIARLPASLRDQICTMIRDNVPYATIIETLGKPVHHINEDNFTNWKNNGYKQWLKQQEEIDLMQKASNLAIAAATSNKAMVVHQASLHLVATQLKEALTDLNTESIREALRGDPENFTRIVNAIARLSEGGLRFERYHAEVARNKAIIERELNAAKEGGGLTPQSIARMQRALNMM
jgi:methyltransferase-like protein